MTDFDGIDEFRGGREDYAAESRRRSFLVSALLAIATAIVFTSRKIGQMTTALEDLTAAVHAATSAEQSAVTLIGGLADQIAASKNDPDAIEALAGELRQATGGLSTALIANTPNTAAPAPVPGPTVNDAGTTAAVPGSEAASAGPTTAAAATDPVTGQPTAA